jgi:1,4-alpha-glucan branching enzyme
MKHKKKRSGVLSARPRLVPVRFEVTQPTATTVCVAGTFNNWHPQANALHPAGNGHWLKETALAPGTYEYCLVVDGSWIPDPLAKETVPNPFGGRNSLLTVTSPPLDAAHLVEAEHAPLKSDTDA